MASPARRRSNGSHTAMEVLEDLRIGNGGSGCACSWRMSQPASALPSGCAPRAQCLSRRIPDKPTLEKEVAAWEDHRNKHHAKANWHFTTDDARVKLKRLYPSF